MQCYSHNVYPFKIFPQKGLKNLSFEPITLLYGSNGSGKSTLLNVIGEKLKLSRGAPFNNTPYFTDYLKCCEFTLKNCQKPPKASKLIASDDVFDFLLDVRSINEGIADRRERIFEEYADKRNNRFRLRSLDDYEELKVHNEAKRTTKSQFASKRLPNEITVGSNGESAFSYFAKEIGDDALYLLDEPENSLSVKLQIKLLELIENAARFFGCQFIIATHSPVLLSIKGARIYDLDASPVTNKQWTELENVREWFGFFEMHRDKFL